VSLTLVALVGNAGKSSVETIEISTDFRKVYSDIVFKYNVHFWPMSDVIMISRLV